MSATGRDGRLTPTWRHARLGLTTVSLAVLAGMFTNCNAVIGAGNYEVCPAPGLVDWYGKDCASCVNTSCCSEAQGCAADSTCVDRQNCLHDCTFPSCALDSCGVQIVKTVSSGTSVSPTAAGAHRHRAA